MWNNIYFESRKKSNNPKNLAKYDSLAAIYLCPGLFSDEAMLSLLLPLPDPSPSAPCPSSSPSSSLDVTRD
jgi:hypothetical protein